MALSCRENEILLEYLTNTLDISGLQTLVQAIQAAFRHIGRCVSAAVCAGELYQADGLPNEGLEQAAKQAQATGQAAVLPVTPSSFPAAFAMAQECGEIRAYPLQNNGEIAGAVALWTDAAFPVWDTALLQRLQESLSRQLAVLLRQNAANHTLTLEARWEQQIDGLLDRFSYQYKAPLTVLLSAMQVLERQLEQPGAIPLAEQRRLYQHIVQNVNRMLRLTDNILDLQRLENGRMVPCLRPCDLGELLEGIISEAQPFAQAGRVRLSFCSQLPGQIPFVCDPQMVERILLNLLSNALKVTPAEGEIMVTAQEQEEYVAVSVKDSGPGMEAALQGQGFRRFSSGTSPTDGAGVGLFLAHTLAQLHGGTLTAENPSGGGCIFVFTLSKRLAPLQAQALLQNDYHHTRTQVELSDLRPL